MPSKGRTYLQLRSSASGMDTPTTLQVSSRTWSSGCPRSNLLSLRWTGTGVGWRTCGTRRRHGLRHTRPKYQSAGFVGSVVESASSMMEVLHGRHRQRRLHLGRRRKPAEISSTRPTTCLPASIAWGFSTIGSSALTVSELEQVSTQRTSRPRRSARVFTIRRLGPTVVGQVVAATDCRRSVPGDHTGIAHP